MNLNPSPRTKKLKLYPIADTVRLKRLALDVSPPAASKAVRAMTLPELLVAIAVGSVILGIMATASMTTALWFAGLVNYVDMDAKSRNALDQMTLKIRQAGALTEFSPTHLEFAAPGQTNSFLVYDWDSATASLREWKIGESITNILLTECDQLAFSRYNTSFAPTTNLSQSKVLGVNWKCSRTILGRKSTTEEMQQAQIVIRNNPI
jgi:prepilin-type N-terminal cleavage/methylation domain-containing protein